MRITFSNDVIVALCEHVVCLEIKPTEKNNTQFEHTRAHACVIILLLDFATGTRQLPDIPQTVPAGMGHHWQRHSLHYAHVFTSVSFLKQFSILPLDYDKKRYFI